MRKFKYENLDITKLYINPDNYRYIEEEANEIAAIIAMFNVNIGEPQKEMINLAKDIVRDGLNPFEMPVVCFDSKVGKYIVYDGNRRITCLKLMTQYKGNLDILREIPTVAEIYKLQYDGDMEIQCVVYENADDAKYFLSKIHNDVNNGIGRKPWDAQAKMKANAIAGNRTEAYAIVEFLKKNPNTSVELIDMINHNRWISKLQRVVEFSVFKETYNIRFDNNKNISYLDEWNRLYDCLKDKKLFSKLIGDNKFLPENLEKIVDPISKKLYIHYLTKTGLIRVFSDNSEQVREFVCQYICKEFPVMYKRLVEHICTSRAKQTLINGLLLEFGDKIIRDCLLHIDFLQEEEHFLINLFDKAQTSLNVHYFDFNIIRIFSMYCKLNVFTEEEKNDIQKDIYNIDEENARKKLLKFFVNFRTAVIENATDNQVGIEWIIQQVEAQLQEVYEQLSIFDL